MEIQGDVGELCLIQIWLAQRRTVERWFCASHGKPWLFKGFLGIVWWCVTFYIYQNLKKKKKSNLETAIPKELHCSTKSEQTEKIYYRNVITFHLQELLSQALKHNI